LVRDWKQLSLWSTPARFGGGPWRKFGRTTRAIDACTHHQIPIGFEQAAMRAATRSNQMVRMRHASCLKEC